MGFNVAALVTVSGIAQAGVKRREECLSLLRVLPTARWGRLMALSAEVVKLLDHVSVSSSLVMSRPAVIIKMSRPVNFKMLMAVAMSVDRGVAD